MEFPFEDAPNTIAITCCHVIEENEPILYVSRDEEDGMWQFLCGKQHKESEAKIVSLYSIYKKDNTVGALVQMPCGYYAEREDVEAEWVIKKGSL